MANIIDMNALKRFVQSKVDLKMDKREAKDLGLEKEFAEAIEDTDETELEIEDILADDDLVAKFATMQKVEEENQQETEDDETEKEEQTKVKEKNEKSM